MTHPARATAIAHPNLALIKYWGKQDDELVLPCTGSLSLTLDVFPTETTVELAPELDEDAFELNGTELSGVPRDRVVRFLDLVRAEAGVSTRAIVRSTNSVPTGAGLASSASGFAALATAAAAVFGLPADERTRSRLARRGSGSASRSIIDDLAIWHEGEGRGARGDATSFAERVEGPRLAMVIAVVSATEKAVSSRVAMRQTIATSPFFEGWCTSTRADLDAMVEALANDDFTRVGELAESNALRMHAAINGARPPIRYLSPVSVAIFDALEDLRRDGLEVYGTADAGPNVAVLCRDADLERAHAELARSFPDLELIPARSGLGARLVGERSA